MIIVTLVFEMIRFKEDNSAFSSKENEKSAFSKFLRFEERFQKAPFLSRICEDGRPNWRNSSGVEELHISAFAFFHGTLAVNLT